MPIEVIILIAVALALVVGIAWATTRGRPRPNPAAPVKARPARRERASKRTSRQREATPASPEPDEQAGGPAVSLGGLTLEHGLYLVLLGVALLLRLWALGDRPLQPGEAADALAAFRFSTGQLSEPVVPSSGLLFALQSLTFLILGSSEFAARVWPALAGSLVVLSPFAFRWQLGRAQALVLSALLAVSPTFVAASRSAEPTMLAWLLLLTMLGALATFFARGGRGWLVAGAVALGLGIAAGPQFITAMVLSGVALGIAVPLNLLDLPDDERLAELRTSLPLMIVALLLATLLGSSLFLAYAPGLTAAGASLPAWLGGFSALSTRSPLMSVGLLALYEPLVLLLGLIGIVAVLLDIGQARLFGILAVLAIVFVLAYPARQPVDALWLVLALAGLSSYALVWLLGGEWADDEPPLVAVQSSVLVLLLVFTWISLASHASGSLTTALPLRFGDMTFQFSTINLVYAGFGLTMVVAVLFAAGWPPVYAMRASAIALLVAFGLFGVRNLWGLNWVWLDNANEVWYDREVVVRDSHMLRDTIADISNQQTGRPNELALVMVDDVNGPLAWQLRDFTRLTVSETLSPYILDPIVITPGDLTSPTLGDDYLGQTLSMLHVRTAEPDLSTLGAYLVKRTLPPSPPAVEQRAVWVRGDAHLSGQ